MKLNHSAVKAAVESGDIELTNAADEASEILAAGRGRLRLGSGLQATLQPIMGKRTLAGREYPIIAGYELVIEAAKRRATK